MGRGKEPSQEEGQGEEPLLPSHRERRGRIALCGPVETEKQKCFGLCLPSTGKTDHPPSLSLPFDTHKPPTCTLGYREIFPRAQNLLVTSLLRPSPACQSWSGTCLPTASSKLREPRGPGPIFVPCPQKCSKTPLVQPYMPQCHPHTELSPPGSPQLCPYVGFQHHCLARSPQLCCTLS